jgi:hypothetical protein
MYHRNMLGEEDLAHRFDYLFEPIDVDDADVSSEDDGDRTVVTPGADDEPSVARPNRLVLAGIVLATLAAATATAVVLQQRPAPANRFGTPVNSTPTLSTEPVGTSQPIAVSPGTVTASVIDSPQPTAVIQSVPHPPPAQPQQPPPQPTAASGASEAPATHPPTTRAPISVSPEPRPPLPNQNPPRQGAGQPGGLLPGLGLPGPL